MALELLTNCAHIRLNTVEEAGHMTKCFLTLCKRFESVDQNLPTQPLEHHTTYEAGHQSLIFLGLYIFSLSPGRQIFSI